MRVILQLVGNMSAVTSTWELHFAASGELGLTLGEKAEEPTSGKIIEIWEETSEVSRSLSQDRQNHNRKCHSSRADASVHPCHLLRGIGRGEREKYRKINLPNL